MSQAAQRNLSEYLQCELCHSVGAYRVADEQFRAIAQRLADQAASRLANLETPPPRQDERDLSRVVELSADYNRDLGFRRHATRPEPRATTGGAPALDGRRWPARDPIPDPLLLSRAHRFNVTDGDGVVQADRKQPWESERCWQRIPELYETVIDELERYAETLKAGKDAVGDGSYNFARSVIAPRDGGAEPRDRALEVRVARRIARYEERRRRAVELLRPTLAGDAPDARGDDGSAVGAGDSKRSAREEIETGCLDTSWDALPLYVVGVQAEAHLILHAVEAWQTMCLGERAAAQGSEERRWLKHELDRAIVLFTFAHSVSRIAPWIFAADADERDTVFARVTSSWENTVPARCTWIANQIGLLTLYRRGYARLMYGGEETLKAYNDFHKLQRLIRDTERRVLAAPTHIEGATDFLASLTAQSHHQIGELYRDEQAHKPALKHFEAAAHGVRRLEEAGRMEGVLANSRWHVELQISRGKAAYELGRVKEALCWHLHAWGRFLQLLAADAGMEANTEEIDAAIEWLERVRFEPELRKSDASDYLGPVVAQLERITVSRRLGALAAEILLRLGHLLFVLNIGRDSIMRDATAVDSLEGEYPRDVAALHIKRTLAFDCLCKAAQCDPYSTLARADLLKARFRFNFSSKKRSLPDAYREYLDHVPPDEPSDEQWPHGRDDYERLTRVAEYLTLRGRAEQFSHATPIGNGASDAVVDATIARHLLLDFFMNTDSTNVRKSQVHRFLMEGKTPVSVPFRGCEGIEFVCMRRYSSAFPMLPRPSAFRALGGGYFVRLHSKRTAADPSEATGRAEATAETRQENEVYGIVIDPGNDFVENLYRTGYCLSDIDMIIITHDHVDHLGSLDPLLSLLHERATILRDEGEEIKRKIEVVVSRSVARRYKFVATLSGRRKGTHEVDTERLFNLKCFESHKGGEVPDIAAETDNEFPQGFEVIVMSSAVGDDREEKRRGHTDLSGLPSHGVCIRASDGPSFAVTSDTPAPPVDASLYQEWMREWEPALNADVLVAHLSSVPLTELRRLDPMIGVRSETVHAEEAELLSIRRKLQDAEPNLEGQVNYAQWLQSSGGGATAEIVGAVSGDWQPPRNHPYLAGTLRWAREYLKAHTEATGATRRGLFVIGELSEELGTMRGKLAARINEYLFSAYQGAPESPEIAERGPRRGGQEYDLPIKALTADIGLHMCLYGCHDSADDPDDREGWSKVPIRILCATCNLDTDRAAEERYHEPGGIREVCVKGENEGIFYNCTEHDPLEQEDPVFLEQLERFDIFGR